MPYQTRKVRNKNCYRLTNKMTKRVLAKCSSKKNVKKQLRLLNYINQKSRAPINYLKNLKLDIKKLVKY